MNKSDLVDMLANEGDLTKAKSAELVDMIFNSVKVSLQKGDEVSIAGLGKFKVARRDAKVGRNPRTGEELQIEAKNVVKFTPAKELKDVVNS